MKKTFAAGIIIGALLGIFSVFSPGSIFFLFLAILMILWIHTTANNDEKGFLTRLFLGGILVRVFLLLIVQSILILKGKYFLGHPERVYYLFGDDAMHTIMAWWYTMFVSGKPMGDYYLQAVLTGSLGDYGRSGYLYLVSLFYYFFGFSPISVTLVNCIIGVLSGLVYYLVAKDIAGIRAAKLTAILITFFPSLLLWSIANLKDPLIILVIGCILWVSLKLFTALKIKYLILLFMLLGLLSTLRPWASPAFLAVIGISYSLIKLKGRVIYFILILAIILFSRYPYFKSKLDNFKEVAVGVHAGVVLTGGLTYQLYNDKIIREGGRTCSYSEFLRALLKGWFHMLFEPFLWNMTSWPMLASCLQVVFLYFAFPFWVLGILISLRKNWNKSLLLVLYLCLIGSMFSLIEGNIGTIFRHRDILTPTMLLFASVGMAKILHLETSPFSIKGNQ